MYQNKVESLRNKLANKFYKFKIWPAYYSKVAITFVLFLIFSFYLLFGTYVMPPLILLFGLTIVIFFFLALHYYSLNWSKINLKKFYKKLFWHSFFYRLIFVGIMYLLTYLLDPQSFPFEINAGDSPYYHWAATKISEGIPQGNNLINLASIYFKGLPDVGFPIYSSIVYYIFGPYTLIIRLLNVVWGSITVIYISKITNSIFGEAQGRLAGIISMLMPAFLWFGGMHLKETIMIFMIITIFYHAVNIVFRGKANIAAISIMVLFSFFLFFFRTFLAVFVIFCVITYFILNITRRKINKGVLAIALIIFTIVIARLITLYGFDESINSTLEQSRSYFDIELTSSAKQRGISYSRALVVPFLLISAAVTPFPSLLDFEERQLGIYVHFQNEVVRNMMYFFAFLGIYYSLKNKFRMSSLVTLFGSGYIVILAVSAVSFEDRFQLPALPFMIMLMSEGFSCTKRPLSIKWVVYLVVLFIAILSWNYFKMSIRGLI
jgi:4-amino-4-deoxy-L-arabinose transferase-like glycosyltransferase